MSKPKYPRIGDIVTITDPRPIEHIGYDCCLEMMIPVVEKDPDVIAFIKSQHLIPFSAARLIKTVAMSRVRNQMKNGAERKIFYGSAIDSLAGKEFRIIDKRVRHTGVYYPFTGGYDYYGEYDYDSAGLDHRKAVVCFNLSVPFVCLPLHSECTEWNNSFWLTSDQIIWAGKAV